MTRAVEPFGGSSSKALTKRLNVGLDKVQLGNQLALAEVNGVADLQAFKVDAQTYVTRHGIEAAALLGQVTRAAIDAVPEAAGGIAHVAEQGLFAIGSLINDTNYELRKIR